MEEKKTITVFDKEQFYKEEILPLLTEIKKKCNRNRVPFYFSACVKNNEQESIYKNDMLAAYSNNIFLHDDRFPDYVNVFNGMTTVYKNNVLEMEMEDVLSHMEE